MVVAGRGVDEDTGGDFRVSVELKPIDMYNVIYSSLWLIDLYVCRYLEVRSSKERWVGRERRRTGREGGGRWTVR